MATKYFIQPRFPDTGDNHWASSPNWSLSSGGPWPGNAGEPTAEDDVVIDANSFDLSSISPPIPLNAAINLNGSNGVCRNLTINTGYGCNIIMTSATLHIFGTLTLNGYLDGGEIYINFANATSREFRLYGDFGTITGVIARKLKSVGGKRIYYNPNNCTVTDTPFWQPCNDVIDPVTGIHTTVCGPITRHIQTAIQLLAMSDHPDDDYILDNNIDLLGFEWTPIGTYDNPFTGTLNGQNKTIKNLNYDDGLNENYAGLFGACGSASSPDSIVYNIYEGVFVQNLKLDNFILNGQYACGALCGFFDNMQAINVHVTNVTITGDDVFAQGGMGGDTYGGGLIPSTFTNCSVNGVTISGNNKNGIGGFCGSTTVDFGSLPSHNVYVCTNCYAKNINLSGVDSSGCYDYGGFAGFCEGVFEKCYAQGVITGVNNNSGGFCGELDNTVIKDAYSNVAITGDTNNSIAIGGFFGYSRNMFVSITNCYSSGSVTGDSNSSYLGGFFGQILLQNSSTDVLTLLNCYSAGLVTSTGNSIGGFCGFIDNSGGALTFSISNCAWWTGSFTSAIGTDYNGDTNKSLTDEGYGTDESDKTLLYHKEHPVYAQGT